MNQIDDETIDNMGTQDFIDLIREYVTSYIKDEYADKFYEYGKGTYDDMKHIVHTTIDMVKDEITEALNYDFYKDIREWAEISDIVIKESINRD